MSAVGSVRQGSRISDGNREGVHERDVGYRVFLGFTAVLWIGCLVLGVVMGFATKTGTGFGDTQLIPGAHNPASGLSALGETWRIVVSFVALGALPAAWYWFLQHLGDFGVGGRKAPASDERRQLETLREDEGRHPLAAAIAYRTSLFSIGFLLLFGNFFLPYCVIRWGWGGV